MLRKYRDATILILLGVVSAVNAILAGIIPNALPESWKPYLWVSWPLFGVFTLAGIVLIILQAKGITKDTPEIGLTQQQRNRQNMLKLVYNTWVEGVLKKSLYNEVLIELGMKIQPDAVEHPWDMIMQMPDREPRQVSAGTRMLDLFNQSNGALLILGEPGSGKTTMLLELAREAIDCAFEDPIQKIPVVFNLSSWTPNNEISDWLVNELRDKYYIPQKISRQWVEHDELLLLLDGLDEVKAHYREECIQAINSYRSKQNTTLAICSRIQEYEALTTRLKLWGAVHIQPLTLQQVNNYLQSAGTRLVKIHQILSGHPSLQRFISSPLILHILILVYRDTTVEDVSSLEKSTDIRKSLFDAYIKCMFDHRTSEKRYSPEQTIEWLKWLAQGMIELGQTLFFIENLNDNWHHNPKQRRLELREILPPSINMWNDRNGGRIDGWIDTLVNKNDIRPVEKLIWSWEEARRGLLSGLAPGFVFGPLFGLIYGSAGGLLYKLVFWIVLGLISAMLFGLVFGLFFGLRGVEIAFREKPGQGIRASLYNSFIAISVISSVCGLLYILKLIPDTGLIVGLILALYLGMYYGGMFVLYNNFLRFILFQQNHIPWGYIAFLDHCTDRIFLRKVGGGYIFIHRMLMEHFAEMDIAQSEGKQ